jgi:transcriptional regulator with XRE-family HTH domain
MNVMKRKEINVENAGTEPADESDAQPLMRAVVAEAQRRGDSLAQLAKQLGVTYQRLTQWRRYEGSIGNAHHSVLEKAAQYLGVPTVLVLVLANKIGLKQFVWPARAPLKDRVGQELARLRQDPFLGAFVPPGLSTASAEIQLFVAFLYHEVGGQGAQGENAYQWLRALHHAAVGDVQAQLELKSLRKHEAVRKGIF